MSEEPIRGGYIDYSMVCIMFTIIVVFILIHKIFL